MDVLSLVQIPFVLGYAYGLPFLVALIVIVFVHELGHFIVARWCGVSIEAFSIGFGKEIVGWYDRHGTRWKLAWIPLGGYVKFRGDANAASFPERAVGEGDSDPGNFHNKALWQRAAVVAAGPAANFILTIAIFTAALSVFGMPLIEPRVGEVTVGSAAEEAGLKTGDLILTVDGARIDDFTDLQQAIILRPDVPVNIQIDRDGEKRDITATPKYVEESDGAGGKMRRGLLGVAPFIEARVGAVDAGGAADKAGLKPGDVILSVDGVQTGDFFKVQQAVAKATGPVSLLVDRDGDRLTVSATPDFVEQSDGTGAKVRRGTLGIDPSVHVKRYGIPTSFDKAVQRTWFIVKFTGSYVGKVLTGRENTDQIGGMITAAKQAGDAAAGGLLNFINIIALLSVSIGIINLLPIPMLDGGHLLFYAIEAVRGKPLGENAQEWSMRIGFSLVIMLMLLGNGNDIIKLITGG